MMGNVVDGEQDPATATGTCQQGQTYQPVPKSQKRYTKEQKELVFKLIDEGKSYRQVIPLIDPSLSTATIASWLKARKKLADLDVQVRDFDKEVTRLNRF